MPEVSRFFGVSIMMRANDHRPPHFHVRYAGQRAAVSIRAPRVVEGFLAPRVQRLVREWAAMHREELLADWALAEAGETPLPIAPLE